MNLMSWKCSVCGRSILSPYCLTSRQLEPYNNVTFILPDGTIREGRYDGCGRVEASRDELYDLVDKEPQVYHTDCWHKAGGPDEYSGPSELAEDQGHFVNPRFYLADEWNDELEELYSRNDTWDEEDC